VTKLANIFSPFWGKNCDLYNFDVANPKMANNMLYHPPLLREKGLKPKSTLTLKKD